MSLLFWRFLVSFSPLSSPRVKNVSFFDDREEQKGHERCSWGGARKSYGRGRRARTRLNPPYLVSAPTLSTCMRHDMDRVVGN
jgi:hypothetical protein